MTEALGAALNRHESIGQARERTVQARKRLDQAQSGPQPSLVLDASYLIQPPLDNPLFREFSPERQRQAKLTLTQPLFRGLREFAALRQSHDFVEAARAGEYQALADLYEAVATAFLQVLALEQDLKNLDEQRAIYSARVKDLLGRSRRGESARNEPLTAQSTQALTIAEIELARARLRTARETFSYMTGLPRESVLSDPTGEPAPKIQGLDFYLGRLET
ncbi:MAG TPA: TolC family protein, partial [Bdellovibrionales bacterium]|nr:TolC family protein [Bdellovibrionales bacterium]